MSKKKRRTFHCGYCGTKHPKVELAKTELGEFCSECLEIYKQGDLNKCEYCQDLYPKDEIVKDKRNQYCYDCYIELTYYDTEEDDYFDEEEVIEE